jgi:hypothetical protein
MTTSASGLGPSGSDDDRQTEDVCPGCSVRLPAVDGPSHEYMTSSAACWRVYCALLAAQYSDPDRMRFHQLVVDTYAVQHPGGDDRRAIQSVGIHLMTLCLFLEHGVDPALGPRLHQRMVARPTFHRIVPPDFRGHMTCADIPTTTPSTHARAAVFAWARQTWHSWSPSHPTVRGWVTASGLAPT